MNIEQLGGKLERFGFRVFVIGIIIYAAGAPLLILGYYLWMGFPLLSLFLAQDRLPAGFSEIIHYPAAVPIAGGLIAAIGTGLRRLTQHQPIQGENHGH